MTEIVEEFLLNMSNHLKKIHKHRTSADAKHNKQSEGKIEITSFSSTVRSHIYNLAEHRSKHEFLFHNRQTESLNSGGTPSRTISSRPSSPISDAHIPFMEPVMSVHEKSYIQCEFYKLGKC